jgi:hypothetical protein
VVLGSIPPSERIASAQNRARRSHSAQRRCLRGRHHARELAAFSPASASRCSRSPPTLGPAVGAGRPARRCWRTKWSSPATRPGSKSRTLCDRARRSASLVKSTHLAHHQHLVEELVRLAPVVGHPTLRGSGSAASERVECKGRSRRQPSTFSHQLSRTVGKELAGDSRIINHPCGLIDRHQVG